MGTSKTGWTIAEDEGYVNQFCLTEKKRTTEFSRRVCVRVDECPETMTRGEAQEKIKRGWEVSDAVDDDDIKSRTAGLIVVEIGQQGPETEIEGTFMPWDNVAYARPHNEAPWIEIVEDRP